jgi:acetyl-CoA carboxylase biotin carboxyl carrier protein
MDIKQIQDLIRFVSKSGVNEVSIEQKDFKITIKTNEAPTGYPCKLSRRKPPLAAACAPVAPASRGSSCRQLLPDTSNLSYYQIANDRHFLPSSSPDKPLFVNVGDEIKTGSCILHYRSHETFQRDRI